MIRIVLCEETYSPPDDDESDYCPEPEGHTRNDTVSFRELVEVMKEHPLPSCSPARGEVLEWLSAYPEDDYRTGETILRSVHYDRSNPPRSMKYWGKAMRAAGLLA